MPGIVGTQAWVIRGEQLAGRGLHDGDRVTLLAEDAAEPRAGDLVLAEAPTGPLAGVLAVDEAGGGAGGPALETAPAAGAPVRLCGCGEARVLGRLAVWVGIEPNLAPVPARACVA